MDFSKIKKRLLPANFSHYQSVQDFLKDVELIFSNCFIFNKKGSELEKLGQVLATYFADQVKKMFDIDVDIVGHSNSRSADDIINDLMVEGEKIMENNSLNENKEVPFTIVEGAKEIKVEASTADPSSSDEDETIIIKRSKKKKKNKYEEDEDEWEPALEDVNQIQSVIMIDP